MLMLEKKKRALLKSAQCQPLIRQPSITVLYNRRQIICVSRVCRVYVLHNQLQRQLNRQHDKRIGNTNESKKPARKRGTEKKEKKWNGGGKGTIDDHAIALNFWIVRQNQKIMFELKSNEKKVYQIVIVQVHSP